MTIEQSINTGYRKKLDMTGMNIFDDLPPTRNSNTLAPQNNDQSVP